MFLNKGHPYTCYFMQLGKYRQHSLLTAVDQITSKPQRMFLQRGPLLPYWAPMKGLAKIQLTLLPNCKEPDCITLLAALSIPEEVFLSRFQEESPPRAAGSGLQLGEPCSVTHGWGGGPEKTHPGQLEPHLLQPPKQLLQCMLVLVWLSSLLVCLQLSPWAGGTFVTDAAYSIVLRVTHQRHWPAQGAGLRGLASPLNPSWKHWDWCKAASPSHILQ